MHQPALMINSVWTEFQIGCLHTRHKQAINSIRIEKSTLQDISTVFYSRDIR